ncbi:C39 family peptidase [Nocardioides sp. GXQ0305]|uniref:C39 family peptidase n=1 Tax=Nocardioides sp. GXQ0305 TaxID=3423912 RepID=UPI003D7CE51B
MPRLLPRLLPAAALALLPPLLAATPAEAAPPPRKIAYAEWRGPDLRAGSLAGATLDHGAVRVSDPVATRTYGGRTYRVGRWTSPWRRPGFALTELVASWQARTPGRSWVEVRVRGRNADGRVSSWDTLARWAAGNGIRRTTVSGQSDDLADVNVDTWRAPGGLTSFQLRAVLMKSGRRSPRLQGLGAMSSRIGAVDGVTTSRPSVAGGVVLDVPRYSQMVHSGHFPAWGGGGQAWCSPTSTSMVLGYHDALPSRRARSWVPDGHRQPWVDHGARMTFDHGYDGTGNWPFNTAYAGNLTGGPAFVTRLKNLRQAERFIKKGIPLVASVSFGAGELDGAPISSTAGHLLVIVGFRDNGNVVVNDPAARTNGGVRRTYDRGQFEDVWLPTSGGLVYVITDDDHPLPGGPSPGW